MTLNVATITVTEGTFSVVGSPPSIDNLAAVGLRRAVLFQWDSKALAPYYWEYSLKIGSAAWSSYRRIDTNTVYRELTAAEVVTHTATAVIQIKVRKSDGTGEQTIGTACIVGDYKAADITVTAVAADTVLTASIKDLNVTTGKIALDAIDGTLIADSAINSEHYANGSIDSIHIGTGQVTTLKLDADCVDGTKIKDDVIDSEHYAPVSIDNEHIADGAILAAKLNSTTLAMMFASATEYTNLITMLGASVPLSYTDEVILTIGTNTTITGATLTAAKTALQISNVSNLTPANQVSTGLDDAILVANTYAVVSNNTKNLAVIAAINASTEAGITINSAKITNLAGTKVKNDALTTALFDSTGRLISGISDGTIHITMANLILAVNAAGESRNVRYSLPAGGETLDNIVDGTTYKLVPANSKLGADYAYIGLHTTGEQQIGVYKSATESVNATRIYDRISNRRQVASEEHIDVAAPITAFDQINYVSAGAGWVKVYRKGMMFMEGDDTLFFSGRGRTGGGDVTGQIRITVYSLAGVLVSTTAAPTTLAAAYAAFEVEVDISFSITGFVNNEVYWVDLECNDDNGDTIDMDSYVWSIVDA